MINNNYIGGKNAAIERLAAERDETRDALAKAKEENARLRLKVGDANQAEDTARAFAAERLAALGRAVACLLDWDASGVKPAHLDEILDDKASMAAVEYVRELEALIPFVDQFVRTSAREDQVEAAKEALAKVTARRGR